MTIISVIINQHPLRDSKRFLTKFFRKIIFFLFDKHTTNFKLLLPNMLKY